MKLRSHCHKFVISLAASCVGCSTLIDLNDYKLENQDVIEFVKSTIADSLPADGISYSSVQVKLSQGYSDQNHKITFKTDKGFFLESKSDTVSVNADDSFLAFARIASIKSGKVNVFAQVSGLGTKDTLTFHFGKAFPNKIEVTVDSFAISDGFRSEIEIKALLSTNNGGKPTVGHPVTFKVIRESDSSVVGDFLNNNNVARSDLSGIAKLRFSPESTHSSEYLLVLATTSAVKSSQNLFEDSTYLVTAKTRIFLKK